MSPWWKYALGGLAAVGLAACVQPPRGSGGCANNADCQTSEVCMGAECIELCNVDGDCDGDLECIAGLCIEPIPCDDDGACMIESVYPECFDASCVDGTCDAVAVPGRGCGMSSCADGMGISASTCDDTGDCPGADARTACDPYVCNDDGIACSATCVDDDDCVAGISCNSGFCATDLALPGDACANDSECAPGASCVNDVCLAGEGSACAAGNDVCESGVCVGQLCAALGTIGDTCDSNDDDDCGGNTRCSNGVCRALSGATCSGDNECVSGNCECVDFDCLTRVCALDDCLCGYGTSGSCSGPLRTGIQDPGDCEVGQSCFSLDSCN